MTQEEYACRAEAVKGRLYRIARLYLGGETAAVDAVDEAVYRGFCALPPVACARRSENFYAACETKAAAFWEGPRGCRERGFDSRPLDKPGKSGYHPFDREKQAHSPLPRAEWALFCVERGNF